MAKLQPPFPVKNSKALVIKRKYKILRMQTSVLTFRFSVAARLGVTDAKTKFEEAVGAWTGCKTFAKLAMSVNSFSPRRRKEPRRTFKHVS